MGILRTREEYLPVTCAILKPEDRDSFFGAIKKQSGGRPDQVARLCEVTVDLVNEWMQGKANVPYHTLQMLAHNFNVTMPPVGELRREYQAVSQVASRREPPPPLPPAPRKERSRGKERAQREDRPAKEERRERSPRGRRERGGKAEGKAKQPQQHPKQQPKQAKGRREQPKPQPQAKKARPGEPSEQLAYWVGATLMTSRRGETDLVMTADRRIGPNFAGSWASLSRELWGVKAQLRPADGGKGQEAALPTAGLEEHLDRLEIKAGAPINEAPVPRWAWSNPAWKSACLKGIVDGCAVFQRAPAFVLAKLPERLTKAVQKMVAALGLKIEEADGVLSLRGDELDKYMEIVGTANMKLRDQYRAYKHPRRGGRPEAGEGEAPAPGAPAEEERESGRVIAEEVEAADHETELHDEALAEEALGSEPGPDATIETLEALEAARQAQKTAAATEHSESVKPKDDKPRPPARRRRSVFRGKPGAR